MPKISIYKYTDLIAFFIKNELNKYSIDHFDTHPIRDDKIKFLYQAS